jgi:hypothetical protein
MASNWRETEAFQLGFAHGEAAANYGQAYENADESSCPETLDIPARFGSYAAGDENAVWYDSAYREGWAKHFAEDFESEQVIEVRAQHASSTDAYEDVRAVMAGSKPEIAPSTAVAIASWWQSPGNVGSDMAAFASGASVSVVDLLADIDVTKRGAHDTELDNEALSCLARFVANNAGSFINAS